MARAVTVGDGITEDTASPATASSQSPDEESDPAVGLSVRHLSVTFSGNKALDDVDLDIRPGEVLGLIGQNGSGKSTLIKTLTNYQHPDPGVEFRFDGVPARFQHGHLVSESGTTMEIRAVHQDLGLIEGLGALDNVGLVTGFATKRLGHIDWRLQAQQTWELLRVVGIQDSLDMRTPLARCSSLHRTLVAIARVLATWSGDHCLLIMDEPTAALAADQVQRLFDILQGLRQHYGRRLSILFVSHRIPEILAIADRVIVLREGRAVAHEDTIALDHDKLVNAMLGHATVELAEREHSIAKDPLAPSGATTSPGETVGVPEGPDGRVHVRGLRSSGIDRFDLTLAPGEIVGVTGVRGSGAEDLPYILVGAGPKASEGELVIGGETIELSGLTTRAARRRGIALVPADRAREGLVMSMPIGENITLPIVRRFRNRGVLSRKGEARHVREWAGRLSLSHDDPMAVVRILSGGNAQKVVLSKAMGYASRLLLLAEPTAGVDIGAKMLLYNYVQEIAVSQQTPVLVQSSDELDLISLCDRVLVFREGRVTTELSGDDVSEEAILRATLAGVVTS